MAKPRMVSIAISRLATLAAASGVAIGRRESCAAKEVI
jgi:hypothetical protein